MQCSRGLLTYIHQNKTPHWAGLHSFVLVNGELCSTCVYCCLVTKLCPTLCDPMDYSPPDSLVHGILLARLLEWIAISFSRGSSQASDWTCISFTVSGRHFFTTEPSGKPTCVYRCMYIYMCLYSDVCVYNIYIYPYMPMHICVYECVCLELYLQL